MKQIKGKPYNINGDIVEWSKLKNEDKVILGNALPIITWGLSSSMSFYNVDFSFNIRGAIGGKLLNQNFPKRK